MPTPKPQPAKKPTGIIGLQALPGRGRRSKLTAFLWQASIIAFLLATFFKFPVGADTANCPHQKIPQLATGTQRVIIGSPAACSPRLTPGLFLFLTMRAERRHERRDFRHEAAVSNSLALHIYT